MRRFTIYILPIIALIVNIFIWLLNLFEVYVSLLPLLYASILVILVSCIIWSIYSKEINTPIKILLKQLFGLNYLITSHEYKLFLDNFVSEVADNTSILNFRLFFLKFSIYFFVIYHFIVWFISFYLSIVVINYLFPEPNYQISMAIMIIYPLVLVFTFISFFYNTISVNINYTIAYKKQIELGKVRTPQNFEKVGVANKNSKVICWALLFENKLEGFEFEILKGLEKLDYAKGSVWDEDRLYHARIIFDEMGKMKIMKTKASGLNRSKAAECFHNQFPNLLPPTFVETRSGSSVSDTRQLVKTDILLILESIPKFPFHLINKDA